MSAFARDDQPTAKILNQKTIMVDTGANLVNLDYKTNLLSRYCFAGNANDAQGANNGTVSGAPSYVNGVYGQAIQLASASSQYVQLANPTSFNFQNSWSFTAWVKRIGTGGGFYYPIFTKTADLTWASAGKAIGFAASTDKLEFTSFGAGTITANTALSSTSVWYHIAVTYNSSTHALNIYINGINDGSGTVTLAADDGTHLVRVARRDVSYGNIIVDQLQFFTGELTSAQVTQIYANLHSGQLCFATTTSGAFTQNHLYQRDAENNVFNEVCDLSNTQTFTNKTISGASNTITNVGTSAISNNAITLAKLGTALTQFALFTSSVAVSTSSTSLVDMTSATVTITATGSRAGLVTEFCSSTRGNSASNFIITIDIMDGSNTAITQNTAVVNAASSDIPHSTCVYEAAPGAGSLTRKIRWQAPASTTITANNNALVAGVSLYTMEIL